VLEQNDNVATRQIFASYDDSEGNADTEGVTRTLEEALAWPEERTSVYEFKDKLAGLD